MDDLSSSFRISAAGMKSQATRLKVIAENIANADSQPTSPDELPYRRRMVTFRNVLDRTTGIDMVKVDKIREDGTPFPREFQPGHPAADDRGYVLSSNVAPLIEMTDLREAQRSYEANLNVIRSSKAMLQATIDVLR